MSAPTNPPPGLRERKKIKLRRAIQAAALRLFETQGYEHTTVEQIAEAAETSTTTFYRYFPTKEDVVLDNDASPLFEVTVAARPAGEPLTATVRAAPPPAPPGRPAGDCQLEPIAFGLAAVLFTASRRWVAEQGATPLANLVDQAITTIEPLLAALEDERPD